MRVTFGAGFASSRVRLWRPVCCIHVALRLYFYICIQGTQRYCRANEGVGSLVRPTVADPTPFCVCLVCVFVCGCECIRSKSGRISRRRGRPLAFLSPFLTFGTAKGLFRARGVNRTFSNTTRAVFPQVCNGLDSVVQHDGS